MRLKTVSGLLEVTICVDTSRQEVTNSALTWNIYIDKLKWEANYEAKQIDGVMKGIPYSTESQGRLVEVPDNKHGIILITRIYVCVQELTTS